MSELQLWYNGGPNANEAKCGLMEHGLHYGTGVFEGIRCYATDRGPAVFRLDDHLARMSEGARTIDMDFDAPQMREAILELLARNKMNEAYIRPIAYFGGGYLGLDVHPLKVNAAVATLPWTSHLGDAAEMKGTTMSVSKVKRNPASAMPPLKLCGGYVNSILAKLSATRRGFDEALFVDDDGRVCEVNPACLLRKKRRRLRGEHPDALAEYHPQFRYGNVERKTVPAYLSDDLRSR